MAQQQRNQDLNGLILQGVYAKLALPDPDFDQWLQQLGLLPSAMLCDTCSLPMTRNIRSRSFICNRRGCRTGPTGQTKPKKGLNVGSFFEHVKLTPKQVFLLSYYWCYEYGKLKDKKREIRTTSHPIVRLEKYFRKVCRLHFRQHPPTIGGPGTIVEVDETCVFKAKYNRGRRFRRHVWLFGGIERGSGRCFLSIVKRRDASTLLRLVAKYIRPGTTVISDCWRAYNSVSALPQAYRHLTVNHRFNFVNPLNGAHTQNVESLWQKLKSEAKRCYGINNPKYKDYLKELMWRRQFGGQEEILFNFWDQIAQLYPL